VATHSAAARPDRAPRDRPHTGRRSRTVSVHHGYDNARAEERLLQLGARTVVIRRKGRPGFGPPDPRTPDRLPTDREVAHRVAKPRFASVKRLAEQRRSVPVDGWIAVELERAGYTTVVQAFDFRPGADFVHEMQAGDSLGGTDGRGVVAGVRRVAVRRAWIAPAIFAKLLMRLS
jgi:hypothetical protein